MFPPDHTVLLCDLPGHATQLDIRHHFAIWGWVTNVFVFNNHGKHALVSFSRSAAATKCAEGMPSLIIRGSQVRVLRLNEAFSVDVHGLPATVKPCGVREHFSRFGIVTHVQLKRNIATVTFATSLAADLASCEGVSHELGGVRVRVQRRPRSRAALWSVPPTDWLLDKSAWQGPAYSAIRTLWL